MILSLNFIIFMLFFGLCQLEQFPFVCTLSLSISFLVLLYLRQQQLNLLVVMFRLSAVEKVNLTGKSGNRRKKINIHVLWHKFESADCLNDCVIIAI